MFHLKTKKKKDSKVWVLGPKEEISLLQAPLGSRHSQGRVCYSAGPTGEGQDKQLALPRGAGEMNLAEMLINLGPHLVVGQETWL